MIPVHELHVGAVVNRLYHNSEKACRVKRITGHTVNLIVRNNMIVGKYPLDKLTGVKLTPDVLESCGFKKDGFNGYNLTIDAGFGHYRILSFSGDYLYLREGKIEYRDAMPAQDAPTPESGGPKDDVICLWNKDKQKEFYLHQLQLLYFSLTLKQLPTKLWC